MVPFWEIILYLHGLLGSMYFDRIIKPESRPLCRWTKLVIGTGDKSELMLGHFTKHGDGGVDLLPIGDLYKTQVRALAKHMGLPEEIAKKPSSPRLWVGQTAEGELGFTYAQADPVLYAWELGIPESEIPEQTGIPPSVVSKILKRVKENAHKRNPPPIAKLMRSKQITASRRAR